MRQPELTKKLILQKAGILFNTQGYKATSLSDILTETGFTKGAIYRHFENKGELESAALAGLMEMVYDSMRKAITAAPTAPLKLKAIFNFFQSYISTPFITGGCPLLNIAIEVDDSDSILKIEAQRNLQVIRTSIIHVIEKGIAYKQIKKTVDAKQLATLIFASLEGAIMMSKLSNSAKDMKLVLAYLNNLVDDIEIK
jgi:TetR/AcrR family transcriptional regulator, transcriptional repressor for nem operon